jgi:hypothetical protein
MVCHFIAYTAQCSSPGIILIPRRLPIGEVINRLFVLWASSDQEVIKNQVRWLEHRQSSP